MLPHPLHPAVVHFPIVLMFILPVVAFAALWVMHDGKPLRTWGWAILAAGALAGSAWVAVETGEDQADTVEQVVAEQAVEQHEDAAHLFTIAAAVALGLSLLGLVPGTAGKTSRVLTVVVSLVVAGLGVRVGALGGDLVYKHGAANAYVQLPPGVGERAPSERGRSDDAPRER